MFAIFTYFESCTWLVLLGAPIIADSQGHFIAGGVGDTLVDETMQRESTKVYEVDSSGVPSSLGHDAQPREWPWKSPTASPTPAPSAGEGGANEAVMGAGPPAGGEEAKNPPPTEMQAKKPCVPLPEPSPAAGAATDDDPKDALYFRIHVMHSSSVQHVWC